VPEITKVLTKIEKKALVEREGNSQREEKGLLNYGNRLLV